MRAVRRAADGKGCAPVALQFDVAVPLRSPDQWNDTKHYLKV
jgi:hypothetical protein